MSLWFFFSRRCYLTKLLVVRKRIKISVKMKITAIGDNLEVGTRPHWDRETQSLYYVDVPKSTIYRYKPSSGLITSAQVDTEPLAFAFPVEGSNDTFIAGLGRDIVTLRWDGESPSVCSCNKLFEVDKNPSLSTNRLNGAKIDPFGRLWAGTMGPSDEKGGIIPGRGSLYSVSQGKLKRHCKDIGISNGLAFDPENQKMYYVDTLFPGIYQFDYVGENGRICNRKIIFKFEDHGINGLPDGLTIDQDGYLWLAVIYGSVVLKINPRTGCLVKKIQMPTSQITALTFGSENLNVLYVNSAKMAVDGKIPPDPAGCTFKVELEKNKGFPGDRYKI